MKINLNLIDVTDCLASKPLGVKVFNVDSVEGYFSFVNVVKTFQQRRDSRLPTAARADQSDLRNKKG